MGSCTALLSRRKCSGPAYRRRRFSSRAHSGQTQSAIAIKSCQIALNIRPTTEQAYPHRSRFSMTVGWRARCAGASSPSSGDVSAGATSPALPPTLRRRNADIPNNAAKQWCGSLVAVSAGEARWRCGSRPSFGPPAPVLCRALLCLPLSASSGIHLPRRLPSRNCRIRTSLSTSPPPPTHLLAPFPPGPTARARRSGGAVLVGVLGRGGAA